MSARAEQEQDVAPLVVERRRTCHAPSGRGDLVRDSAIRTAARDHAATARRTARQARTPALRSESSHSAWTLAHAVGGVLVADERLVELDVHHGVHAEEVIEDRGLDGLRVGVRLTGDRQVRRAGRRAPDRRRSSCGSASIWYSSREVVVGGLAGDPGERQPGGVLLGRIDVGRDAGAPAAQDARDARGPRWRARA